MMRVRHCITLAPTQSPKLPPNQTALTSLPVITPTARDKGARVLVSKILSAVINLMFTKVNRICPHS